MNVDQAMVLLSGGLDSVAALHWAHAKYSQLAAIAFDYGQPNRDAELYVSQSEAEALGVPWQRVNVSAMFPRVGLLAGVQPHDVNSTTINKAFVPGRNLVFMSIALSHALFRWRNGNVALVIGACQEDARGFPDCTGGALAKAAESYRHGSARQVDVVAPWIDRNKTQIIRSLDAAGVAAVQRSWSCYQGSGPCGVCSACVLRAAAFTANALDDLCAAPMMTGGDGRHDLK